MRIFEGRPVAAVIRRLLIQHMSTMSSPPRIGCLLVGDDQASHIYVGNKRRVAEEIGAVFEVVTLPASASAKEVEAAVQQLNKRADIDSFIVQLPLPATSRAQTSAIIDAIAPEKDVDGLTAATRARIEYGDRIGFYPTPAFAILVLIAAATGDENWSSALEHHFATGERPQLLPSSLKGRQAVVVSNGDVFGSVLQLVLEQGGLKTAVRRSDAPDMAVVISRSDIVVPAVGLPGCITGRILKHGAFVFDVGTTMVGETLRGDVDWESVQTCDVTVTPVPGGVGPVTVACLFANAVVLQTLRRVTVS